MAVKILTWENSAHFFYKTKITQISYSNMIKKPMEQLAEINFFIVISINMFRLNGA